MNPAMDSGSGGLKRFLPFGKKEVIIPGQDAGWRPFRWSAGLTAASDRRRLMNLLGTYGGTDDSVTWVYACVSLIQQELASYPYEIMTPRNEIIPHDAIEEDLRELLDQPNEDMTYFDFVEFKAMDEELAGNSYWLKDEPNLLGQPLLLRRLRPECTKVAVGDDGIVLGYVYTVEGTGLAIPYERDQVIHFKRPNPLSEYYGMGTVEAIQRALNADLAETDHVVGFFANGARISGVLTTNTLSEGQFERFKEQFYEEYQGDANAHKILIAEEGTRFEPITQPPGGTGVADLRSMTKDEILSGFGIPEFLLGGAGQAGVYKMEEAQHIFGRKMVPKARRQSEKLTRDLTSLWGFKYRVNVTFAEPRSVKVERAGAMLQGGASINESRHEMDLPRIEEFWADLPIVPQGAAPFGMMDPGGAPIMPNDPALTQPPNALPAGLEAIVEAKLKEMLGTQPSLKEIAISVNGAADFDGMEPIDYAEIKGADSDQVGRLVDHQRQIFRFGTTEFTTAFEKLFKSQRRRVMLRIGAKSVKKSDINISLAWDSEAENKALLSAYVKTLDTVAARTMETNEFEALWQPHSQFAKLMKQRLGEKITAVNEETRKRVADKIAEGLRRGYNVQQISFGVPAEGYEGIDSVFDDPKRVKTIARTETATAHNVAMLIGFRASGVSSVVVFDGAADQSCREAQGAVWTVAEAMARPVEHPNCTRFFAPRQEGTQTA